MKIKNILLEEGFAGYYFDDLKAIKEGALQDGLFYVGRPKTQGFTSIRQAGKAILITIILENNLIAFGDCVAVQYSGVAGREPLLLPERDIPFLRKLFMNELIGKNIDNFRDFAAIIESLRIDGERLHAGIRYGLSQAIINAVSAIKQKTIAEVIAEEYNLSISQNMIPIFLQTGEDRYIGADKMILKRVQVIPHGLFNNVNLIGKQGEKLLDYLLWLKERIKKFSDFSYQPIIQLDLYGTLGDIFNNDINGITTFLSDLKKITYPYHIRVECPILMQTKEEMVDIYKKLNNALKERKVDISIVINEFCNTLEDIRHFVDNRSTDAIAIKTPDLGSLHDSIEAVMYCKKNNIKAFLAGTCNSTDVEARIIAQVALATNADQITGRPGMGVDEALQITYNEMKRTLTILKSN